MFGARPDLDGEDRGADLGPSRWTYTIALVTHNMQQAARVSDYTAFMYLGELIEFDRTEKIFTAPRDPRTRNYVTGRFG